jgi:hypothetical protein
MSHTTTPSTDRDIKLIAKANKLMAGWTIIKVDRPLKDECILRLHLSKENRRKIVTIFGTDLGGWIE